jgi:endogenous inhibitor of DNA gyrase (YacG/DUF329 family)
MESENHAADDSTAPNVTATCPICQRRVEISSSESPAQSSFFPFCSQRCKLIDLGAWLDAEYRIPERRDEPTEEP